MRNIAIGHKCANTIVGIGGHRDIATEDVLRYPALIRDVFYAFRHEYRIG
jgi:hypothetical protein